MPETPPVFRVTDLVAQQLTVVDATYASYGDAQGSLNSAQTFSGGDWTLLDPGNRIEPTTFYLYVVDPPKPTVAEFDYTIAGFGIDATSDSSLNPDYLNAIGAYLGVPPRAFLFGIKTGGKHGHIYGYKRLQDFYVPVADLGIIGGKGSPFDTNFNISDFNRSFLSFVVSVVSMGYASAAASAAAAAAAEAGETYSMTLGQTLNFFSQANAATQGELGQSFLGDNAKYIPWAKMAVQVIA